ncbi:MAG: hypothetical protein ACOYOS_16320 [Syntrophales bacterium]
MAINDVSLTAGMRSNLIALQGTVDLLNRTQDRLSTGKKVNTALDNPLNFFTAKSLNSRAADLAGFKDGMSEAVQAIKAANYGISAIEGLLAQAKAVAATAKSGTAGAVTQFTVDLSSVTSGQTINVGTKTFTAVATDNMKSIDFTNVAVGNVITVGNNGYTAAALQKTIDFAGITTGSQITIGSTVWVATTGTGTIAATQFYTAGTTSVDMTEFLTRVGITGATTDVNGLITLSVDTSALTISSVSATGGGTVADVALAAGSFYISTKGATPTVSAATGFLALVGGTNTSSGLIATLGVVNSALTTAENGADLAWTDSVGATEFYIGGATNTLDAVRLAAKITIAGEATAALSGSLITLTGGSINPLLTTSVSEAVTSFTTEVTQTATADRTTYASQFDTIMAQLDLLATDSSYKGINFLSAGSSLVVEFGTTVGDSMTMTGFDSSSTALLAKTGSYLKTAERGWQNNTQVDVDIAALARATETLKTESSRMSSGLSIINTRQDWIKAIGNTLTEGADKLTLADMNEEGANMLMLQTRQTLGTTALSLSAQAAQSVLRLFA